MRKLLAIILAVFNLMSSVAFAEEPIITEVYSYTEVMAYDETVELTEIISSIGNYDLLTMEMLVECLSEEMAIAIELGISVWSNGEITLFHKDRDGEYIHYVNNEWYQNIYVGPTDTSPHVTFSPELALKVITFCAAFR